MTAQAGLSWWNPRQGWYTLCSSASKEYNCQCLTQLGPAKSVQRTICIKIWVNQRECNNIIRLATLYDTAFVVLSMIIEVCWYKRHDSITNAWQINLFLIHWTLQYYNIWLKVMRSSFLYSMHFNNEWSPILAPNISALRLSLLSMTACYCKHLANGSTAFMKAVLP